jgi:hypothetical protein
MKSRQRKYQLANKQMGLCQNCGVEAETGSLCSDCADKNRIAARERYRKRKGIPLDAPLYNIGNRTKK